MYDVGGEKGKRVVAKMLGHGKDHDCIVCRAMFGGGKAAFKCGGCAAEFSSKEELAKHAREKHKM